MSTTSTPERFPALPHDKAGIHVVLVRQPAGL
jgi:hypothetical protein